MNPKEMKQARVQLFRDAANFKKTERIPHFANVVTWKVFDAGYTLDQAMTNFDVLEETVVKFLDRYSVDGLMDHLSPLAGQILLQDRVAILAAVLAGEGGKDPLVADFVSALKEKNIPLYALSCPFGGHALLMAVPQEDYLTALLTLYNTAKA